MRFNENELIFLHSITKGTVVPELELHFAVNEDKEEAIQTTIQSLGEKGLLDDETKLNENGYLVSKAFEDYKLAGSHVVINNLFIAITDVDCVAIVPLENHEFELARMPRTVVAYSLIKEYDILREGSYPFPPNAKYASVEDVLQKIMEKPEQCIYVKQSISQRVQVDCTYYWTKREAFKYDLRTNIKKNIDPVTIRHDIAKLLKLEEEKKYVTNR